MIQRPEREWVAHGRIVGADFDDKTLLFKFEGDLMPLVAGRYAIIPADTLRTMTLRLMAKEK